MFALFKNHNPFAVIGLFILTLLSRIVYLGNHNSILIHDGQYLWSKFVGLINPTIGSASFLLFLLMVVNIFGQALLLNRISTQFDLFPKNSYLPAYNYILFSALLPVWSDWTLHAVLVWLFLLLLQSILGLYHAKDGKKSAINVGLLTGVIALLSFPCALILIASILGLLILRPFKLTELLCFVVGCLTPYYLFIGIAYITDNLHLVQHVLFFDVDMIDLLSKRQITVLSFLGFTLLPSLLISNQFINRMLIEYKKYWNVILLFFVISALVVWSSMANNLSSMTILLPTLALFFNFVYLEQSRKWIPNVASLLLLIMVISVQWFLF